PAGCLHQEPHLGGAQPRPAQQAHASPHPIHRLTGGTRLVPRFAANLSFLYPEVPLLERIAKAAADGFGAVEYVSPYELDKAVLAEALDRAGVVQALFNLPAGDWAAGERGIACHPDRVQEFRQGIEKAIEYAKVTGCRQLNCLAGIAPEGFDRSALEIVLIENLSYAAPRLAEVGI